MPLLGMTGVCGLGVRGRRFYALLRHPFWVTFRIYGAVTALIFFLFDHSLHNVRFFLIPEPHRGSCASSPPRWDTRACTLALCPLAWEFSSLFYWASRRTPLLSRKRIFETYPVSKIFSPFFSSGCCLHKRGRLPHAVWDYTPDMDTETFMECCFLPADRSAFN